MNAENSKKLIERFEMFRRTRDPRYPFPMFGFECGDGWFQLIWNLCEDLEKMDQENFDKLPEEVKAKSLLEQNEIRLCVDQVKEKFGSLRFYISSGTEEMYDRINKAEEDSTTICETCGKPGKLRREGWFYTACDDHVNDQDKED